MRHPLDIQFVGTIYLHYQRLYTQRKGCSLKYTSLFDQACESHEKAFVILLVLIEYFVPTLYLLHSSISFDYRHSLLDFMALSDIAIVTELGDDYPLHKQTGV
jgi:hypothetical protein